MTAIIACGHSSSKQGGGSGNSAPSVQKINGLDLHIKDGSNQVSAAVGIGMVTYANGIASPAAAADIDIKLAITKNAADTDALGACNLTAITPAAAATTPLAQKAAPVAGLYTFTVSDTVTSVDVSCDIGANGAKAVKAGVAVDKTTGIVPAGVAVALDQSTGGTAAKSVVPTDKWESCTIVDAKNSATKYFDSASKDTNFNTNFTIVSTSEIKFSSVKLNNALQQKLGIVVDCTNTKGHHFATTLANYTADSKGFIVTKDTELKVPTATTTTTGNPTNTGSNNNGGGGSNNQQGGTAVDIAVTVTANGGTAAKCGLGTDATSATNLVAVTGGKVTLNFDPATTPDVFCTDGAATGTKVGTAKVANVDGTAKTADLTVTLAAAANPQAHTAYTPAALTFAAGVTSGDKTICGVLATAPTGADAAAKATAATTSLKALTGAAKIAGTASSVDLTSVLTAGGELYCVVDSTATTGEKVYHATVTAGATAAPTTWTAIQ